MTSNMESTKKFNLESFMAGNMAKTISGQTAKFVTISRDRMIVIFSPINGMPSQETYQLSGQKYKGAESPFDLVEMV